MERPCAPTPLVVPPCVTNRQEKQWLETTGVFRWGKLAVSAGLGGGAYLELVDPLPRWRPHAAVDLGPRQDLEGETGTPSAPASRGLGSEPKSVVSELS